MSNKRKEWRPRGPRENTSENGESSSQQSNRTPHRPVNNQQNYNGQFRSTGAKRPRSSNEDTRTMQHPHHQPQRQQPRQIQQHQSQHHFQSQLLHPRPNHNHTTLQSRKHQQQHQAQARTQQHQNQHHRERINQAAPVIRAVVVALEPAASSASQDPVVRDIPGFYYDLEKKKYFKITANHTLGGQFAFSQQSIKEKTSKKPTLEPIKKHTSTRFPTSTTRYGRLDWFLQDRRLGLAGNPRRQLCHMHELMVKQWRRSKRAEPVLAENGAVYTHLQVDSEKQDLYVSTSRGELWRHHFSSSPLDTHSQWMRLDSRETSELTSLHVTRDQYLVTTHLGNMGRSGVLRVQKSFTDTSSGSTTGESGPWHTVLEYSPKKSNVWTSGLAADRIVIGADKAVIALQDWKSGRPTVTSLWTGSDVFSVAMEPPLGRQNLIYAGCRNGRVRIFDLSQPNVAALATAESKKDKRSTALFRGIGHKESSVLGMKRVGDHYLVTSAMNGEILMWDTRFVGSSQPTGASPEGTFAKPVMDFRGPIQDQFSKTLFDINAGETLLAAENIDQRISLWSLSTGDRIHDLKVKGKVGCLQFAPGQHGIWTVVEDQVQFWGLDP
ncbi:DDB1 and CUL4 associated factor 4-like 2 [Mortierella sp. GBA39]|nr:DDB1 and CUL4 associated factor 4-like 2 [Mortierella sp. GBA39]